MSKQTTSRARAPNFTTEDQELLMLVIEPFLGIIESKKTDNVKLSEKTDAWAKVSMQYNANTKNVSRSTENLISCYRNMKSKIKKQHSEAKMNLRDPVMKEELVNAIEKNGEDWNAVAKSVNQTVDLCKAGLSELKKEYKKHEVEHKKLIMGTGGGPPRDDEENPLKKLKKILEPQVDGVYTMYDGDADLMKKFQESLPEEEQVLPIEIASSDLLKMSDLEQTTNVEIQMVQLPLMNTPVRLNIPNNRQEILKKKRDTALASSGKCDKPLKKNSNEAFLSLTEAKSELVKLQTELISIELLHKKQMMQLEMEDLRKEHKFKEELRQKKLMLLDLEIKKKMTE